MLSKKWLGFVLLLWGCILLSIPVFAKENGNEALPEITTWKNGQGYQEDGTQILDSWAYDLVNPAGKYVLFGADGTVLRKAENLSETEIVENYTGTELEPSVLALRAEVFEGFQGTVLVVLQEKSGLEKTAELTADNFFSLNVQVNSGTYTMLEAEAWDGADSYVTEFSSAPVQLPEKEMRVLKIQVTERKEAIPEVSLEQPETESERFDSETEVQSEQQQESEESKENVEGEETKEMDWKKTVALFGIVTAVCISGAFLMRKRRKTYQ